MFFIAFRIACSINIVECTLQFWNFTRNMRRLLKINVDLKSANKKQTQNHKIYITVLVDKEILNTVKNCSSLKTVGLISDPKIKFPFSS